MPIDLDIEAALDESRDARAEALLEFARIPSVAREPEHAGDVRAAAEWIAARLRNLGATEVEVDRHGAPPDRLRQRDPRGRGRADRARVLPLRRPAGRPHRAVGDGPPGSRSCATAASSAAASADDKGQLVMHLGRSRRSRTAGRSPVNLTFVFEGEEEYGSE